MCRYSDAPNPNPNRRYSGPLLSRLRFLIDQLSAEPLNHEGRRAACATLYRDVAAGPEHKRIELTDVDAGHVPVISIGSSITDATHVEGQGRRY